MSLLRFNLLVLAVVLASTAQAAPQDSPATDNRARLRPLDPAQINNIRVIGRNILAAKKSGVEDSADAEQVERLRASLDQLIAADFDPKNREPITVQGEESDVQRSQRTRVKDLRIAARSNARAMAAQLHNRSDLMIARTKGSSSANVHNGTKTAGFPIEEQRARLFDRWARKLDSALTDENPDRIAQLQELREQLRPATGKVIDAPLSHGTPTLQAMPAGYAASADVTTNE